ncbi:MAG: cytochrome B6 [Bdellovibrionales bacterium GWB1_55_8]|nr:MAG: cytochrome B6 [Bdellovibrionales bacterium GWB1_55_8]
MSKHVKSSPHLFRLINRAWIVFTLGLIALSFGILAPLQEAADFSRAPNPAKSGWFLLWIQELVSYSKYLIYPVLGVTIGFLFLPWLAPPENGRASWFTGDQRLINAVTAILVGAMIALTIIAAFFRGENWALIWR